MDKELVIKLKKFRIANNYTQEQMGKLLGIGMAMYGKIETGKHPGGPKVWDKANTLLENSTLQFDYQNQSNTGSNNFGATRSDPYINKTPNQPHFDEEGESKMIQEEISYTETLIYGLQRKLLIEKDETKKEKDETKEALRMVIKIQEQKDKEKHELIKDFMQMIKDLKDVIPVPPEKSRAKTREKMET